MKTEKKTGAARTQLAVTDEWWTDERVKAFLGMQPVADEPADYHVLLKAYRGMVPEALHASLCSSWKPAAISTNPAPAARRSCGWSPSIATGPSMHKY